MSNLYSSCSRFYLVIGGTSYLIHEPTGWDKFEIKITRDKDLHGMIYEFGDPETELIFTCPDSSDYSNPKQLITDEYNSNGVDGSVTFQYGSWDDETFTPIYQAKINFSSIEFNDYSVVANLERTDFQDLFRTRYDVKIKLNAEETLDGDAITPLEPVNLLLHSKVIQKKTKVLHADYGAEAEFYEEHLIHLNISDGGGTENENETRYLQFQFDNFETSEVNEFFSLPIGWSESEPVNFIAAEEVGVYDITGAFYGSIEVQSEISGANLDCGAGVIENISLIFHLKQYDKDDNPLADIILFTNTPDVDCSRTNIILAFDFSVDETLTISIGDKISLFAVLNINGDYERHLLDGTEVYFNTYTDIAGPTSYLQIVANTQAVGSNCNVYYIHESLDKALEIITGQEGALISNFLGREEIGYDGDGCGSANVFTNGFQIRKFEVDTRPVFTTAKEIITGAADLLAIGVGIEQIEGVDHLRAEQVEYFYQDVEILEITENIFDYQENVATDYIFNEIEIGFSKYPDGLTDKQNTLDEFLTHIEFLTPIKSIKKKYSRICNFILSGHIIEENRRVQFLANPTNAGRDDDGLFLIAVKPKVDIVNFSFTTGAIWVNGLYYLAVGSEFTIAESDFNNGTYEVESITLDVSGNITQITPTVAFPSIVDTTGYITFANSIVAEKDEDFDVVNNLISPGSSYNLPHSLKRILYRHSGIINSGLYYKSVDDKVKFTYGVGNYLLETQLSGSEVCTLNDPDKLLVTEGADIEIQDLNRGTKLFKPEIVKFSTIMSIETVMIIKANMYGYVSFLNLDGDMITGYILSLSYSITEEVARLELIKRIPV